MSGVRSLGRLPPVGLRFIGSRCCTPTLTLTLTLTLTHRSLQVLLRLLAAEPPRLDEDGAPVKPLSVPANWETSLAKLLTLDVDEAPEEGWLGAADPLEGCSFFDAPPVARLALLRCLSERWLLDDGLAQADPPAGPKLVTNAWHGAPLGADAGGARYFAVPGEARIYKETSAGKWELCAATVAETRALMRTLGEDVPAHKAICQSIARGLLPPLEDAEAAAAAERAAAAAAERRDAEAVLSRVSRGASLRTGGRQEAERRAKERDLALRDLAARQAESAEAARAALREFVPERFRTGDWQAALFEHQAGGWCPPPQGAQALGRHVSVRWPSGFFAGTVSAWNAETGVHTVTYWDGDIEQVTLTEETVAWHAPVQA